MTIDWKAFNRSLGDFVLAQLRDESCNDETCLRPSQVTETAKNVQIILFGELTTVGDIVHQATQHGWNSMIYEAWSWEFGNRVKRIAKLLSPLHRQALLAYAQIHGDIDISAEEAFEAIEEARRELYCLSTSD